MALTATSCTINNRRMAHIWACGLAPGRFMVLEILLTRKMTQQTQMAVWFLLSSLLCVCLSSSPPLSTIHKIDTRGRQQEQIINRGENVDERGRLLDQDTGQEMDVVPLSAPHYIMWKDIYEGNGSHMLKRGRSLPSPHPQLSFMSESGKENGDKISVIHPLSTGIPSSPTTKTADTTTAPMPTTTVPYPVDPTLVNTPPPSSSSCSSPGCKWLASRYFIAVVCMAVIWLVVLMMLYFMTRTDRGKLLLETWSAMCTCVKQDKDKEKVLAKGIGYFDGSPGMRRFVLIEDEDDEEEEEEDDDLFVTELKDETNKEEDKETEREGKGENRSSKKWKPPRKGTYILQEASKKDVLEVGTYRLEEEEDEEEVDGKEEGSKEEEVKYILEGATYILQSERVEREGIGGEREGYGQAEGIEGLYGVVTREGVRGGYGRIDGLERVYGIVGRGTRGQKRYRRSGGIGLYGILQEGKIGEGYRKVVGVGGKGEGGKKEDGVLLSVKELEGTVGGEENIREERTGEEVVWRELEGRGDILGSTSWDRGGGREVNNRGVGGWKEKRREEGKRVEGRWGERMLWEGARPKVGRVREEGMWGGLSPPSPKRAASFPMDHFLSSHLMPRKLSLIEEEENH